MEFYLAAFELIWMLKYILFEDKIRNRLNL
jgi:hypothetical protein